MQTSPFGRFSPLDVHILS